MATFACIAKSQCLYFLFLKFKIMALLRYNSPFKVYYSVAERPLERCEIYFELGDDEDLK